MSERSELDPASSGSPNLTPGPAAGSPPAPLLEALCEVLEQGRRLALRLDPGVYAAAPEGLASSGAGPHLRHSLDFCRRLLEGLDSGRIDYDRRERDPREETDPAYAARQVEALVAALRATRDFDPWATVQVRHDLPAALIAACDEAGARPWTGSTLGREVLFVLSHTIHHYALIAMALRHHGIDPGADFGVAPSTLRYWATEPQVESQRTSEAPLAAAATE